MSGGRKKPALPQMDLQRNDSQRGGLGRGLSALIPTGPAKPRLGNSAADVILGSANGNGAAARAAGERDSSAAASGPAKATEATAATGRADTADAADRATGDAAAATNEFGATYQELPVGQIRVNPKNPRQVFEEEPLNELVHSIREFGLLQPVVVRPLPAGEDAGYELIMGERRLRATELAGLATIPSIVRETDDQSMLRDALLENIHRVNLNPLEEASAYQQLLEEFGVTQAELAKKLGRSRPVITNMIRLLALPVPVQRKVAAGVLSAGHARALLGVKGPTDADISAAQEALAGRIVAEGLSVRATEEAVVLHNRGEDDAPAKRKREPREQPPQVREWATSAADALDTRVTVQMGAKKGRIVVEFGDSDDFERITDLLRLPREEH
jgi:ParB family chromosome partitioning protein